MSPCLIWLPKYWTCAAMELPGPVDLYARNELETLRSRFVGFAGQTFPFTCELPFEGIIMAPSFRAALRLCRWLAIGVFAYAALQASLALADSAARTVDNFGLFGTWANDCSAAPSPANQYVVFSLTSRDNVELRNDFGPDYAEMVYQVVDAKRLSYFRLALRQLLTTDEQVALNVVMMKANDRIRMWSSYGADGNTLVENGEVPSANGRETSWMVRCNMRTGVGTRAVSRRKRGTAYGIVGRGWIAPASRGPPGPDLLRSYGGTA